MYGKKAKQTEVVILDAKAKDKKSKDKKKKQKPVPQQQHHDEDEAANVTFTEFDKGGVVMAVIMNLFYAYLTFT